MKALIIEPMRDLQDTLSSGKDRFIIVLDGLDECGSHEALEHLMKLVLALQELPPSFSVLVSCRPEPGVISAWSEARTKGLVVPCEDVDEIAYDENFRIIYVMVEEGLRDLIDESPWKPIEGELGALARACRQSPVMASIRVRDVRLQTRRGRTLQLAFQNLVTLADAPADFNWEYLRILRQAYMLDSLDPVDVAKYRSVLFGIAEPEIRAMLEPISSIIHLPSQNTERVNFYHATAKEFITGDPIGEERDEVFFINDVEGYSLGLPLLRLFNSHCERNAFGVPTELPLGDRRKWEGFMTTLELFSEESNELRSEFDSFITQNLLTLAQLQTRFIFQILEELREFDHHNSIQALRDLEPAANYIAKHGPSYLYRSFLPFAPLSSSIYKLYGSLSDPIRIFSIFGEFSGDTIPLSKDLLSAQEVMQAKLSELRLLEEINEPGIEVVNYEAEFREPDIRNAIVTCAALSPNGHYVALGFGNGIIEVADIDHQCTVCRLQHDPANPPIWIDPRLWHGPRETLPTGPCSAGTAVSDNGFVVVRIPQNFDNPWYDNMMLISVFEDPSIQLLASPPSPSSLSFPLIHVGLHTPHRRTLGFSPGARYIGAFDGIRAFTWSTKWREFIASYCVTQFDSWIIRPSIIPPSGSYLVPPVESKTAYTLHSKANLGPDSEDESWIKCPFYGLSPSISRRGTLPSSVHSFVTGRTPLIESSSMWINGSVELVVPVDFEPHETCAWYGDRIPPDVMGLYRPQSSRDGTRFLLQGQRRAPIVVDISQIRLPSPVDSSGMRDSNVLHSWSSGR
ncbi:uncharacterized protein EI90DRAFT_3126043 [Cantharellus anzutake]|uniref:uncharacterized protein n=1 Tax=Cantharellus anzutake TaxID=1750568 RepID=UPI001906FCC5|nr:uncharacterized protein EI90DRAFT_3126043 [Cantharellus anzutake]KAF8328588.1 hypothetical protein EI90DRAFT_3126043 [Cantharellus anzutake]